MQKPSSDFAGRDATQAAKRTALVHAVALVHERLIVAVYPDNAEPRKLKIDDGVDGQSQRRSVDQCVQPLAFAGIAHSESCDERAGQGEQQQRHIDGR